MKVDEGKILFAKIRIMYPMAIMCGSLSLIILNKMEERDIHDVDFLIHENCVDEDSLKEQIVNNSEYPSSPINHGSFRAYNIMFENNPVTCFVYNDNYDLRVVQKNSVLYQDPDITIKKKMELNREKDLNDKEKNKWL